MKNFFLICLILTSMCCRVHASELTEDYLDIAANYCIEGNYNEALSYLNKILAIEPNNVDAKELKVVTLRVMNPLSVSYISSHSPQIKQSILFKRQGNKTKELAILLNASNSNQNNYWICYYLAEYYRKNNNYTSAINYYQKAVSIKPNFTQCYLNMAILHLENNNNNSAIININKYLQNNPNVDIAYSIRAQAYNNQNNFSNAQSDIQTALKINDDINYTLIQAKILFKKGDYDKAREVFEILSKDIKTSEVYKYLGLCDYKLGNYTNALLNLDKAIILSDEDKTLNSKYNEVKDKLERQNET